MDESYRYRPEIEPILAELDKDDLITEIHRLRDEVERLRRVETAAESVSRHIEVTDAEFLAITSMSREFPAMLRALRAALAEAPA